MSSLPAFIASIVALSVAQLLKALRQKQFVELYEAPATDTLLNSIVTGYSINIFVPLRFPGCLIRALLCGKKMKNGFSLSLASVVFDEFLDTIVLAVILSVCSFVFFSELTLCAILYIIAALALILICILAYKRTDFVKNTVLSLCSVFNDETKFNALRFFRALATMLSSLLHRISKIRFILFTVFMWICYLLSYYLFSWSVTGLWGMDFQFPKMLLLISSGDGRFSDIYGFLSGMSREALCFFIVMVVYIFSSLFIPMLISVFLRPSDDDEIKEYLQLVPQYGNLPSEKCMLKYFGDAQLNSGRKHLAIFDLDGTLFDTVDLNYYPYCKALEEFGFTLDYSFYVSSCYGKNYKDFLPDILGKDDPELCELIHGRKKALYKSCLKYAVKNEHLFNIISSMKPYYHIAIVTCSSEQNCIELLRHFDVLSDFELILTQEKIEKPKPDPEGFITAMKHFGISASNTLIFEDSPYGIEAARASGAAVFTVNSFTRMKVGSK